ncbi:MAG: hypothetical protein HC936_07740 [Leptolyngbyaceae cyanobacterium SU_3_3]|nr:hypothetical protein [Leptolyngbyaceae cyanobacterium SU_3_3]
MSTQADTSDPVPDLEEEWAENQLESAEKTSPSLALDLQINQLITELESIAEQGTQTSNKSWMKRWQLITQKFEAMGMSTIVPLLKSGLQIRRPVVILQLRYLCQLLSKASNFSL